MTRLLTTDLWYRTYQAALNLRTEYWLIVDGVSQPDPLNPRSLAFPSASDQFNGLSPEESWFELPEASAQPWLTQSPKGSAGTVEYLRLASRILSNERPLTIYTPPGYPQGNESYPLLVLF